MVDIANRQEKAAAAPQAQSVERKPLPNWVITLASITILLLAVGITACLWPARQATRLNPVTALRYE